MIYQFFKIKKNNYYFKKKTNPKIFTEFESFINFAKNKLLYFGLTDWSINFDYARRRAGICNYDKKVLSFSIYFLRNSSKNEINDTLLHEIAHALVGPKNGHNNVWKKKALDIGCTAKVYHKYEFAKPKWIKFCSRGCWLQSCFRKKNNLICKICGSNVSFKTYS